MRGAECQKVQAPQAAGVSAGVFGDDIRTILEYIGYVGGGGG